MREYEKKHLEALRPHLAECTVLLKKNGAFPLKKAGTIAAYGSGVRRTLKGGTGSGEVNSRFAVTVERGLEEAGFMLISNEWLLEYDRLRAEAKKAFVRKVKEDARKAHTVAPLYGMGKVMPEPEYNIPLRFDADAAVYVLSRICGEGNDREAVNGDLFLTESEIRDILLLNERYEHFMLALNVGGPVDLTPVKDVGNILILSQLGVETGAVLADILLGRANPSGKLTTTWSSWEDYCPDIDFGDADDTRYREGIYVGYRYFDTVGKKAMFPFGFGLSYSEFCWNFETAEADGSVVTVSAEVENTGLYAGQETLQLYVSLPEGKLDKPRQDLAGFAKTDILKPGAKETLAISFDLRDLASYDESTEAYILEAGSYILRLGTDSAHNTAVAVLQLDEGVTVRRVRSIVTKPDFRDSLIPHAPAEAPDTDLPVLSLSAEALFAENPVYDRQWDIHPEVRRMADDELAKLNVGAYSEKGGILSVIGNASQNVAGAAGETAAVRNLPVLIMADGPAGLRLTPQYYRDAKGLHGIGSSGLPESVADYLPAPFLAVSRLLSGKAPEGKKVEEQYATAIPIGTAIAQSWNPDFAELCGNIVGQEMERFGVHLWLAPALNIHRSILCGRNFEYYSEDPLVSGIFAAAITRGVQKHPGCGTTIKHFCANNQEKNRMNSNSQVSERALREIYLKGFQICVKLAQPAAVMTSYNLLNGVHTSESRGLLEDYLRAESGYKGIVMTDWVVSIASSKNAKYRGADAGHVAKAGGDIYMPGSKADFESIMALRRSGELTRRQLEENASRMIRIIRTLTQSKI